MKQRQEEEEKEKRDIKFKKSILKDSSKNANDLLGIKCGGPLELKEFDQFPLDFYKEMVQMR